MPTDLVALFLFHILGQMTLLYISTPYGLSAIYILRDSGVAPYHFPVFETPQEKVASLDLRSLR